MTQPSIDGTGLGIPRMPYGSDGTDWYAFLIDVLGHLQVDVVSAALGTGGATATNQATMITALQLIDDLRNALGSVATDKILVASKSGDKIFGFESIVEESLSQTDLPATTYNLDGTPVPAGKIWKITVMSMNYTGTVPTCIFVVMSGLGGGVVPFLVSSPVSNQWYCWNGDIYLQVGDFVQGYVVGGTLHDDFYVRYAGVQMNVP